MTHVAISVGGRYFTDENEQMGIVRLLHGSERKSRVFNGENNEEPEAKKYPLSMSLTEELTSLRYN